MRKSEAIELLGGNVKVAAKKIGASYQAVSKWPPELTPKIADRVQAALYREAKAAGRISEAVRADQATEAA